MQSIDRILQDLYPDMSISGKVGSYILDLVEKTKDSIYPGDLEVHAKYEEVEYRINHPDASQDEISKVRQKYLLTEILEAAGNVASRYGRSHITRKDVMLSIKDDEDLRELLLSHMISLQNMDKQYDRALELAKTFSNELETFSKQYPAQTRNTSKVVGSLEDILDNAKTVISSIEYAIYHL